MALVVICGQPCSGKSTATICLSEALQTLDPKPTVKIIDESSLHLGRNQSYAGNSHISLSLGFLFEQFEQFFNSLEKKKKIERILVGYQGTFG